MYKVFFNQKLILLTTDIISPKEDSPFFYVKFTNKKFVVQMLKSKKVKMVVDNWLLNSTLAKSSTNLLINYHHRNWYIWDPSTNRYEDHGVHMRRPHYQGAFTRIPEDAMILRDCKLN